MKEAPPLHDIWEFAERLTVGAVPHLSNTFPGVAASSSSTSSSDCLSKAGALQLQAALVSRIVSGTDTPPWRLSIIKTVVHPSKVSREGCLDPNCHTLGCKGNRVEIVDMQGQEAASGGGGGGGRWQRQVDALGGGGGSSSSSNISRNQMGIQVTVHHHKNEHQMQNQGPLVVCLPPGRPLTDMMVHWIQHGWHALVSSTGSTSSSLFMSSCGNAFSDSTFCHYWKMLLGDSALPYFPPNLVRTSFVEAFTAGGFSGLGHHIGKSVHYILALAPAPTLPPVTATTTATPSNVYI